MNTRGADQIGVMAIAWLTQAGLIIGTIWVVRRSLRALHNAEDRIWFASGAGAATARLAFRIVPVTFASIIFGVAMAAMGMATLAGAVVSGAILVLFASVCALGLTLPNIDDPFRAERAVRQQ
jgi:hypothetical protein